MSGFPPFADLVPHADPMVLLDEMVEWAPGEATCRLVLAEDAPFVRGGAVDSIVCIEYMAQAVAACLGYEAFKGGVGVRVGMIIGARTFELHQPSIPVGSEASVSVSRIRGNDTLSHFEGSVVVDGQPVASGQLTLFHAERPPE